MIDHMVLIYKSVSIYLNSSHILHWLLLADGALPPLVVGGHGLVSQHTLHVEPFNLAIFVVTGYHIFVKGGWLFANAVALFFHRLIIQTLSKYLFYFLTSAAAWNSCQISGSSSARRAGSRHSWSPRPAFGRPECGDSGILMLSDLSTLP